MMNFADNINNPKIEKSESSQKGKHFRHTLKFKSYLFIALLLSYIAFIATFVIQQRHDPLQQLQQYQDIQISQQILVEADIAAFHIITALFSGVSASESQQLVEYFSRLQQQYLNLKKWFPEESQALNKLSEALPVRNDKISKEKLKNIYVYIAQSKNELDKLKTINHARLAKLVETHRKHTDSMVIITLALGIMGLALLGAITSLFFNQLKDDINALQKRTAEIVDGYRGQPLLVNRRDEIGQLTHGVNEMASALAQREQQLEIQHSKAAFMQKMSAIDSLAGGIAHEIGNPVSCISALADDIKTDEDNQLTKNSLQSLNSLLDSTEILVKTTHDLSVIDTHKSNAFELLDINQLISNTYNIFRYDKRCSNINISLELDYSTPAIFASVNQITQLISNIIENSIYAIQNTTLAEINIKTQQLDDNYIMINIRDNGSGIDKELLQNIFDPFFSTKPVGEGGGLGLTICWSIATAHEGSISATSVTGKETEIHIILPIRQAVPSVK